MLTLQSFEISALAPVYRSAESVCALVLTGTNGKQNWMRFLKQMSVSQAVGKRLCGWEPQRWQSAAWNVAVFKWLGSYWTTGFY